MHIVRNTAQNKLGDGGIMCAIFVKCIFQVSNILRPRSSRVSRTATTHTLRTHTVVGWSAKRCTLLQTLHVHVMRVGTLAVISASVSHSFPKKEKREKRKHMRKRLLFLLHTAFALTIGADTMAGRTSWTSRWNQTNCLRTRSAPALYSLS